MVKVMGLTPEELRISRLSDNLLTDIWVSLTSPAEREYFLAHVCKKGRYPPNIGLYSWKERDKIDFETVETIVTREVRGELSTNYDADSGCYGSLRNIPLKENPTQSRVADWVQAYRKHFKDVKILVAYFDKVPKSVYEDSGLPPEKLVHFKRPLELGWGFESVPLNFIS